GGATRKADLTAVNLAAPLVDGTQVLVPARAPAAAAAASPSGARAAADARPPPLTSPPPPRRRAAGPGPGAGAGRAGGRFPLWGERGRDGRLRCAAAAEGEPGLSGARSPRRAPGRARAHRA